MSLPTFFNARRPLGSSRLWLVCVAFLGALSTVAGCETAFEPFSESGVHFTILGYLDSDADTQFVRVIPIRPVVERLYIKEIDAAVHSVDLSTGSTSVWQDSVIQFSDSSYGHVFWSQFYAEAGHRYRLEVQRSDGSLAWAETTVPERPVEPEQVHGALNETADHTVLFWPGVQRVIAADVLYDLGPYNCETLVYPPRVYGRYAYRLPYEGSLKGETTLENEWRINLRLWADRDSLMVRLRSIGVPVRIPFCALLYRLEIRLATPSDDFEPPGGVWDRDVLIQPGTFSNVHDGLGFFGSVVRTSVNWQLSPIAQISLGYAQE